MSDREERLTGIARVYGPEAWDLYDRLDQSLDPRGPDMLVELAIGLTPPHARILDVGCRDASHLIQLVHATDASGAGIDPVPRLREQAQLAVQDARLDARIEIVAGVVEELPFPDASFDLVWCRDVLEIVDGLDDGVAEMARVLQPGGALVVFTVFATDRLEPRERQLLIEQNLTLAPSSLVEANVEAAFARAGLETELKDAIGTEWREHAEERNAPASRDLLRLARLRRRRDEIVAAAGEELYNHLESNLHWSAYQFLGKLMPTVYVLRKR